MADLDIQLKKILDKYIEETEQDVDNIAGALADEGVEMLKANSPQDRPRYYRGWKKKVEVTVSGSKEFTVYNARDPSLTHLLEHGHPIVKGGKAVGRAAAYPHIRPVEQELIRKFIAKVKP